MREIVKCRVHDTVAIRIFLKLVRIRMAHKERHLDVWRLSLAVMCGIPFTTRKHKDIARRCILTGAFESLKNPIFSTLVNS